MMFDFSMNSRLSHTDADRRSTFETNMPPNAMHSSAANKRIVKFISNHAKERVVQRSETVKPNQLIKAVELGKRVVQSDKISRIHALATYGESEYYHYNDIVVVVSNDQIITSLSYDKTKWKPETG